MKTPGTNYLMLRLALLIAPFAAFDRALAINNCDATSPVSNTIITCAGATSDANGTKGYGTNTDTPLFNSGMISGSVGIVTFETATITNSGAIIGTGGTAMPPDHTEFGVLA